MYAFVLCCTIRPATQLEADVRCVLVRMYAMKEVPVGMPIPDAYLAVEDLCSINAWSNRVFHKRPVYCQDKAMMRWNSKTLNTSLLQDAKVMTVLAVQRISYTKTCLKPEQNWGGVACAWCKPQGWRFSFDWDTKKPCIVMEVIKHYTRTHFPFKWWLCAKLKIWNTKTGVKPGENGRDIKI